MMKSKKEKSHIKGWGCQPFIDKQREARKCSCGREGIGLTKYGDPVCYVHDQFPTNRVEYFPPLLECPGPHD